MKKIEKEHLKQMVNPFTTDLTIPVRVFRSNKKVLDINNIDLTNGYISRKPDTISSEVLVDDTPFSRVFTPSGYRLHIMALPKYSKSVFLWLIYEIEDNQDWIWINRRRYKSECGGTWTDLQNGINGLIDAGIITGTSIKDCYWFNPRFFFKGNRIKFYPEKIVERI